MRALVVAFVLVCALTSRPALSEDTPAAQLAWREISTGAEVGHDSWSLYVTSTIAPMGWLDQDGPRLRTTGGYGQYRYAGTRTIGGARMPTDFRGVATFSEVLIGYQLGYGAATFKGFAGAAAVHHKVTPFDAGNETSGGDIGVKAAVESWVNLGEQPWLSLDASWTAAHDSYASRLRAGWRVLPQVSAGIEAGAVGIESYDNARGGMFLRWAAAWGEVSASGGRSRTLESVQSSDTTYGTLNVLVRY